MSKRPYQRLKLDDVLFALKETHGLLTDASTRLGCQRSSLYLFIARHKAAQDALKDAREFIVDKAVKGLIECLEERQPWAIAMVLKSSIGGERGWGTTYRHPHPWELLQELREEIGLVPTRRMRPWDDGAPEMADEDETPPAEIVDVAVPAPMPAPMPAPVDGPVALVDPPAPVPASSPDEVTLDGELASLIDEIRRKLGR